MGKDNNRLIKIMNIVIALFGLLGITIFNSRSIEEIILNIIKKEDSINAESESISFSVESSNVADNSIEESQIEKPIEWQDEAFGNMIMRCLGKQDIYPEDLCNIQNLYIYGNFLFISNEETQYTKSTGKKYEKYKGHADYLLDVENNVKSEYGFINTLIDLNNFPNLISINIECQKNIALDAFEHKDYFKKLESLSISYCHIDNDSLNYISNLSDLKLLVISNNDITDITPLGKMENLLYLRVSENNIQEIECVKYLKKMIELDISQTNVKDITVLNNCPSLENVIVFDTPIKDFSGLSEDIQIVPDVNNR